MPPPILLILKLIRKPRPAYPLRPTSRKIHKLPLINDTSRLNPLDNRPQFSQQLDFLRRRVRGQKDVCLVALGGAQHRQTYAGAAGGAFVDGVDIGGGGGEGV